MTARKRYEEIDLAKGFGILLVVLGHCFPDASAESGIVLPLFRTIHDVIYVFHMPLMFFIAGFLSKRIIRLEGVNDYRDYISKRFIRLMLPYFVIGLLYMPAKIVFSQFANQPFDMRNIGLIFLGENPDGGLWYLYALFLIQLIMVFTVNAQNIKYIVVAGLLLSVGIMMSRFSFYRIDDALYYVFFVSAGLYTCENYEKLQKYLHGWMILILVALFATSTYIFLKFNIAPLKLVCGILGTALTFCFSKWCVLHIQRYAVVKWLMNFGQQSMDIYVLHGIVMVAIRIVLWSVLKMDYFICTAGMLVGGLFIPGIISKFILRKSRTLKLLFLGENDHREGTK